MRIHEINMAQYMKQHKRQKSEQEVKDKFTKQLVGMRKGKQYDFEKLENPDMRSSKDNTKEGDDTVALMLAAARKKTLL